MYDERADPVIGRDEEIRRTIEGKYTTLMIE
jgi:ATP-dependent Clp protease ATP-binding subunit ClpA